MLRRLLPLTLLLALLGWTLTLPAAGADGPASTAKGKAKGAGKGKKCGKGKTAVTVVKGGKRVKKCKKKAKPKPACPDASAPGCANPPGPARLFDPPGQKLEGEAARPFLEKYLVNSTFTDCPAIFPNCSVEHRYSHYGSLFYYCRLTMVSGADIINGGKAYEVKNAVVETDGSWTFNEFVENSSGTSFYEWHVAANGAVNGAYQFNGGEVEQLGGLTYVSGGRDCSY